MSCFRLFMTFVVFSFFVTSLHCEDSPTQQLKEGASLSALVKGNSQFAFDLYHQLKSQRGNLFFSPYSISMAFQMTASGARGETALEIQKVLYYFTGMSSLVGQLAQNLTRIEEGETVAKTSRDSTQLILANAIWLQEGLSLLPSFEQTMQQHYRAPLETVNFEKNLVNAIKTINQWAAKQTRGKISQILSTQDISKDTRLVLTSAIYMKGQWQHVFDQKLTQKAPFYVTSQHPLQTEMMNTTATYPLFVDQTFAMIEVPYAVKSSGPQLSMIILLPNELNGLDALEKVWTLENWRNWLSKMQSRKVNLFLPKFREEEKLDLNQTMMELGIVKAFEPQADFSGITGKPDLFIGKAIHKTFIRVDEKGTEAAAVTAVGMVTRTSLEPQEEPYAFVADHPFLFAIIDKNTNSILFMGRLVQP